MALFIFLAVLQAVGCSAPMAAALIGEQFQPAVGWEWGSSLPAAMGRLRWDRRPLPPQAGPWPVTARWTTGQQVSPMGAGGGCSTEAMQAGSTMVVPSRWWAGLGSPWPTARCRAVARFPWAAGSYISSLFSESKEVLSPLWRCDRRRNNLPHSSSALTLERGAVAFAGGDVKPNHFPAVKLPGEQVLEITPSPPDLHKSSATEIKDNPAASSK